MPDKDLRLFTLLPSCDSQRLFSGPQEASDLDESVQISLILLIPSFFQAGMFL